MQKYAVVTGSTDGIGLETCIELMKKDVYIIAVARNKEKAEIKKKEMMTQSSTDKIEFVFGNLDSTKSRDHIIKEIKKALSNKENAKIDYLVHVAGGISSYYINTPEAYEQTFAVNHLAVFHLTIELLPLMRHEKSDRILVTSSSSHYRTRIHWKDVMLKKHYLSLTAYKQSKLANVLFVREFAVRYPDTPIFAIDPGLVNTNIGFKNTKGIESFIWRHRALKGAHPKKPASEMVEIMTNPIYDTQTGLYYKHGKLKKSSHYSRNPKHAPRLWSLSEKLVYHK
ncbi:MAG: SDR family NAD(P)-dependent oxidoreductase [Firmicutes bacterium]|nr:SDR family NAD(P)-dependent oxidoreductase [Bacillota bacterium]